LLYFTRKCKIYRKFSDLKKHQEVIPGPQKSVIMLALIPRRELAMRLVPVVEQCCRVPPGRGSTLDRRCWPIKALAGAAFAVSVAEIDAGRSRSAAVALARQSAMYLAHVALGLTFSAVGRAFGRDRTTAAHACDVVERRREDPRIEAVLVRLERACAGFAVGSTDAGRRR
jgi:hypothetical protein